MRFRCVVRSRNWIVYINEKFILQQQKSDKQSRSTWDCCRWVTAEIRKSTNRCILVQDVLLQHVRFGCELPLRWTRRAGWKSIQKSDPIFSTHPFTAKANLIADIPQRTEIWQTEPKKATPEGALGSNLKYHPLKLLVIRLFQDRQTVTTFGSPDPKPWKWQLVPIKSLVDLWRKKVEQLNDEQKQSLPMSSHILNDKSWRTRSSLGWVRLNPEALFVAKPVDHCRVLQVLKDF